MSSTIVRIRAVNDCAFALPQYQSALAAGVDLQAHIDGAVELQPGARVLIPTGFAIELPPGFEAQVRPRSGLALKHGVTVLNSPGTIDADYRGEIQVLLVHHGTEMFTIQPGERIAQLVVAPVTQVEFLRTETLSVSARGGGGYGSTGR
jgi:dUTP pyrophosphatase